jgi:two-component system nitrogen regulation response regulator NtrX
MSKTVLIVDDEADIRSLVSDILKEAGYTIVVASDGPTAVNLLKQQLPSIILLDIWLQGSEIDGLGVLEIVREQYPMLPVVMMSGHGTIETAVNAIKMGAYDYLVKPFTEERLLRVIQLGCQHALLERENGELKKYMRPRGELIGASTNICQIRAAIEKVGPTASRVLLTGPRGSGKEVVAQAIHSKSKRASGPFITFSTGNKQPQEMMRELFGSPMKQDHAGFAGAIEKSHMGTLYIDEITDLPLELQQALLRFLQDQTLRPQAETVHKIDVRVISASYKNIDQCIRDGTFLQDLYYRLNVVQLNILPLQQRREDIPLLSKHYLSLISHETGLPLRLIADDAMAILQAYSWPGNVRQLRNVAEWLLMMAPPSADGLIHAEMLPADIATGTVDIIQPDHLDMMAMPLREAREVFERQYLLAQMQRFSNNISRTSSFVGMERSALHRKLKSLNIHTDSNFQEDREEASAG